MSRYIDQLLVELEAVQQRLAREEEARWEEGNTMFFVSCLTKVLPRGAAEQRLKITEERVQGQEATGRRLQAEV